MGGWWSDGWSQPVQYYVKNEGTSVSKTIIAMIDCSSLGAHLAGVEGGEAPAGVERGLLVLRQLLVVLLRLVGLVVEILK